mmetsp:Transcript_10625/g.16816  ORF Transcript_10625/g.16816 Transcript_10625/m.16816 type:complete len:117 (+) Transcript_10625:1398-1748(+)|eukprot:1366608-Amorphochlora_amoeboformis.AAC.1
MMRALLPLTSIWDERRLVADRRYETLGGNVMRSRGRDLLLALAAPPRPATSRGAMARLLICTGNIQLGVGFEADFDLIESIHRTPMVNRMSIKMNAPIVAFSNSVSGPPAQNWPRH